MPRAFVTGATGFVGLNLVKRLTADGWSVTALHRKSSNLDYLTRFEPELVCGDIVDAESVLEAMPENVDVCFHVAASTSFWSLKDAQQTRINVGGTANVVQAALERGVRRFVHTSSVGAYGIINGEVSEDTETQAPGHWINYFRTKWLAEEEVRRGIEAGLDAVLVNPGNILGPYDLHNWARVFSMIKAGKLRGVLPGTGPWCHVDSVVSAHLAAAERGTTGDNYLIGAVTASYLDLVRLVVEITGGSAPDKVAPAWILRAVARMSYWGSLLTRKEPDITPEVAALCTGHLSCGSDKAQRELGYREVSLREMVQDTHDWLVAENRL